MAERTQATLLLLTTRWDDRGDEAQAYLQQQAVDLAYERLDTMVVQDRAAADAILIVADEPETVVCMSTHGRGGLGQAVLGSVAEEVVRHARWPLLLVGPSLEPGAWQFAAWFSDGKLMVPVDGSATSEAVVPAASEWARLLDLQPSVIEVLPAPIGVRMEREMPESDAVHRVVEALASVSRPPRGEVLQGEDVAASLLDYANGLPATLIAMTTHGRTGISRVTFGSVTMRVVHHSPCPVLVVRSPRVDR